MFLSVKELELRKVRFNETFEPGAIDFAGEDLEALVKEVLNQPADVIEQAKKILGS